MADRHRRAGLALARELAAAGQHDEAPDAPPGRGQVGWSGPELVGDERDWRLVHGPTGPGLYAGTSGIALALAGAYRVDGDAQLRRIARRAAASALAAASDLVDAGVVDLAAGSAGIGHAVAWTGALTGDDQLQAGAQALARRTAARLADLPPDPDYLGGTAGAVVALLATHPADAAVRAGAGAAAERIAQVRRDDLIGVSWPPSPGPDATALLGLAHGTSGTALALLAAAEQGAQDAEEVAAAAWDRERSWFDQHSCNWPDLRDGASTAGPGTAGGMVAWCHGAVGVGCARLRWLQLRPDLPQRLAVLAEVTAAIEAARRRVMAARAALREGVATDASLCHGLTGVTELLLAAAELPGGADHARAAGRVGDLILAEHEQLGRWPCGLPTRDGDDGPPQPPGLFLGLAGIALGLLRLDDAAALPSMALPRPIPRLGDAAG